MAMMMLKMKAQIAVEIMMTISVRLAAAPEL
jgi:hypothetical protein